MPVKQTYSDMARDLNNERKEFIQALEQQREDKIRETAEQCIKEIGPAWYQVLSNYQLNTLINLRIGMKQDLLEERAWRTRRALHSIGLYPLPSERDILRAVRKSRLDTIVFLSELYAMRYSLSITTRLENYPIYARFIISGIYNLALNDMKALLKKKFTIKEEEAPKPEPKKKEKKTKPVSPYLEKMVAFCPDLPVPRQPYKPAKLPDSRELTTANYEEEAAQIIPQIVKKKKPKPPKARLSIRVCDQLAGLTTEPEDTNENKNPSSTRKFSRGRTKLKKNVVSSNTSIAKEPRKSRKSTIKLERAPALVVPQFGTAMYNVGGVVRSNGQLTYMINSVVIGSSKYVMVHGGFVRVEDEYVPVNSGLYSATPTIMKTKCDCMKWWGSVKDFLDETECKCGHFYDFGDLSNVPPATYEFFHPPTPDRPYWFDLATIFDLNEHSLFIRHTFKDINEKDSVIGRQRVFRERAIRNIQSERLSVNPTPSEYLKCVLKTMSKLNVIASLPDAHLANELVEWMRFRMYGPRTKEELARQLVTSFRYWQNLAFLEKSRGLTHVRVPKLPFPKSLRTNWSRKWEVKNEFNKVYEKHTILIYERYANILNIYWPTMRMFEKPRGYFRDAFFSYLGCRLQDLTYHEPYDRIKVNMRIPKQDQRLNCYKNESLD